MELQDGFVYDDELVMKTLRLVVERKGEDYVYKQLEFPIAQASGLSFTTCVYMQVDNEEDQQPSCLVGHVMWELGEREFYEGSSVSQQPWQPRLTDRATVALSRAQAKQDGGTSWGYALKTAEHWMKEGEI